jgi:SpoVK/Ycf46/Vps4 family AAA+-type ATPase
MRTASARFDGRAAAGSWTIWGSAISPRRVEAVVYVPPPRAEERLRLWREGLSARAQVTADLERIARDHDLTGGAIINVILKVSLVAIARGGQANREGEGGSGESPISQGDTEEAIRSERGKNG